MGQVRPTVPLIQRPFKAVCALGHGQAGQGQGAHLELN